MISAHIHMVVILHSSLIFGHNIMREYLKLPHKYFLVMIYLLLLLIFILLCNKSNFSAYGNELALWCFSRRGVEISKIRFKLWQKNIYVKSLLSNVNDIIWCECHENGNQDPLWVHKIITWKMLICTHNSKLHRTCWW